MSQCAFTTGQKWIISIAFVLMLAMMSVLSYLFFVYTVGVLDHVMLIIILAFDVVALGGGVHMLRKCNRRRY